MESGTMVTIEEDSHSHRQIRRSFTITIAESIYSSHNTIDKTHVSPQVG
jgi:hypothetical protein